MIDKNLVNFIGQARKRGFSDLQIREPLIREGWPISKIQEAFLYLQPKFQLKNQISVFLSDEILKALEKRAKKNMLNISEQIEDILRRSCIRKSSLKEQEKIDDFLITCFSRKPKRKK